MSFSNVGGFRARRGDGEPGVKTLWQGYAGVNSFVRDVEEERANHAIRVVWNGMGTRASRPENRRQRLT